ncbi:MAG: hypothetical protein H7335_08345 [Massilia sp.]|nr:hypothetical protein [Massilia sp.]
MKASRRLVLFVVGGSACLLSFAVVAAHRDSNLSDYEAVCSYILKEDGYAKSLVSPHGVSRGERFFGNRGDNAREYRLHNPGVDVSYVIASDNRIFISSLRMTGSVLLLRAGNEKSLADKLHVRRPFPPDLKLGCDLYALQITAVDGKIRSLTIEALID